MNSTKVMDLTPLEGIKTLSRLALNWLDADLSPGSKNREIFVKLVKNGTAERSREIIETYPAYLQYLLK